MTTSFDLKNNSLDLFLLQSDTDLWKKIKFLKQELLTEIRIMCHTVRHPRCVFINYNWINQLSNTIIWWLDICCLFHRYQLHVSALMAIVRLID